jgi:hypothetical protein
MSDNKELLPQIAPEVRRRYYTVNAADYNIEHAVSKTQTSNSGSVPGATYFTHGNFEQPAPTGVSYTPENIPATTTTNNVLADVSVATSVATEPSPLDTTKILAQINEIHAEAGSQ